MVRILLTMDRSLFRIRFVRDRRSTCVDPCASLFPPIQTTFLTWGEAIRTIPLSLPVGAVARGGMAGDGPDPPPRVLIGGSPRGEIPCLPLSCLDRIPSLPSSHPGQIFWSPDPITIPSASNPNHQPQGRPTEEGEGDIDTPSLPRHRATHAPAPHVRASAWIERYGCCTCDDQPTRERMDGNPKENGEQRRTNQGERTEAMNQPTNDQDEHARRKRRNHTNEQAEERTNVANQEIQAGMRTKPTTDLARERHVPIRSPHVP